MAQCYSCGAQLDFSPPVGRSAECPSCRKPVRACRNCVHYEVGRQWDCREHIPEPVHDKEAANFCEWFRLGGNASRGGRDATGRDAFDSLFS